MAVDDVPGQSWSRKHDDPAVPVIASAPHTVYPKSLEELVQICSTRAPSQRMHAAGSHWSLSDAAISDTVFVETHDPTDQHQAMGRTLYDVVPPCLNPRFIGFLAAQDVPPFDLSITMEDAGLYPIHVETGKRVYQLYAELDEGDSDPQSLAVLLETEHGIASYRGPWAFRTLGNSGGQTVFGALTTGTHGGDFYTGPIADSVMALHLVADGGKHYWIEPASPTLEDHPQLTIDEPLRALYGQNHFGGPENFAIIRNDDIFDSVLMGAGRFGIVYSIVVAAVRQYSLHQERRLTTWRQVKDHITDPTSALYAAPGAPTRSRFLQVAVSVTPHANFGENLAGVTKRWNVPLAPIPGSTVPAGRPERVGAIETRFDNSIQGPRFARAGNSHTYDPHNPGLALPPSFLTRACSSAAFMAGVVETTRAELRNFIDSNGAVIGTTLAAVIAVGGGGLLLALLVPLLLMVVILDAFLEHLESQSQPRLGQTMNDLRDALMGSSDPVERAAGTLVWHMIAFQVFASEQSDGDYEAISYAVMEGHNYLDKSCNVNIDSIEVFFDATDSRLIAFVDALLAFEIGQEVNQGKAMVGFISLRFTGRTRAMLGQQRWGLSCAVEVAGMRDVAGTTDLIDFASTLALNSNFKGILHWGQRNESTRTHIEERFGDTVSAPTGPLHTWRTALSRITENGRLDGFSNAFTRRTGLEIVTPAIGSLQGTGGKIVDPSTNKKVKVVTISWDCARNPPTTTVSLAVTSPSDWQKSFINQPLVGQAQIPAPEHGLYTATLTAAIDLAGQRRELTDHVTVSVA